MSAADENPDHAAGAPAPHADAEPAPSAQAPSDPATRVPTGAAATSARPEAQDAGAPTPEQGARPAAGSRYRDLSSPDEDEPEVGYPDVAPDPVAAQTHRRGIVRAYVAAVVAGIVLDVVVIAVALVVGGGAPLAALLGSGLALIISVPSLVPVLLGLDKGIGTFAVVVLGVWLVKMIVLVGGVILVRGIEGVPMPWVGVALLAGGLASLITEAVVLLRIRTDPTPSVGAGEL
ncbi:hypothetical protein ACT3TZ_01510 [Brachybacterium sp. AOP25-B2-12]|uniref:hypothetical protein n=1 Tax=Brachybacterium sp. AOP25-B2-12 TaxID=3457710 RepID=UPI004033D545